MRSRAVRVSLTLLAVGALAAAAYFIWNIDQRSTATAERARDVDARLAAAVRQTYELRAAQQAYVAAGQSEQFWIVKVTESVTAIQETISSLRASGLSTGGQASLDRAAQALDEFARLDRRARDYAASEQRLLASDLIFSDGLEGTQQIVTALDEARGAENAATGSALREARRELAMTAGGGAAAALIGLLLLTPAGARREEPVPAASAAVTPSRVIAPPANRLDLELTRKPREPEPVPAPVASVESRPELQDVADVCTQLARATDTASLPAILKRTALALDAAGIVLWVANPDGTELIAVASHGYPVSVLSQMGPLPREAENVTAGAFRTGLLQVVKGDANSNGAIAAPLVNTSGSVGVLSAEVRHDAEREPARLSFARIVAAQLATLIAPATRSESRVAL
jgi:hypothetical protein